MLEVLKLSRVDKVASEELVGQQLPSKYHHQQARTCSNRTRFNKRGEIKSWGGCAGELLVLALLKVILWWGEGEEDFQDGQTTLKQIRIIKKKKEDKIR